MEITLQYFEGCPNWRIADEHLRVLATERPDIIVRHQLVESPDEAERVGFHGSPSIIIDGVDAFPDASAQIGFACRRYLTPAGPAGSPTLDQLRSAVRSA